MRKLAYLYYLLLTMCLVSCVNDNDHLADDVDDIVENGSGVYGTLSSMEPVKQRKLKSTMSYDYGTKTIIFSWEDGDKIGVFPYMEDNSKTQATYKVTKIVDALRASFEPEDGDGLKITKDTKYFSYFPVKEKHDGGSNAVPVSFRDQVQENMVNMKEFYSENGNQEEYKASEKES